MATVNGSSGPGHLDGLRLAASRGGISGYATQLLTDPDAVGNSIAAIQLEPIELGTGSFFPVSGAAAGDSALVGNALPVRGALRLCLVTTTCFDFLEVLLDAATTNGGTIGVGIGGLLTLQGDGPIVISILAAPWTLATVTVVDEITTTGGATTLLDVTLGGFVHDPVSGTTNTASPSGVVQLVTPIQITSNIGPGSLGAIASGVVLRIRFVPEPGLLVLLGAGGLGLALLGRARSCRPPERSSNRAGNSSAHVGKSRSPDNGAC